MIDYFCLINLSLAFQFSSVSCTIDINLPELQYIADRLELDECVKLAALLHFRTFETPVGIEKAEEMIDKGESCLQLLLHWNSSPGEGLGETHEILAHRLRQIGRYDLSDWLSSSVFEQLGQSAMEAALSSSFKKPETYNSTRLETTALSVPDSPSYSIWRDSISIYVIIFLTIFIIIGVCLYYFYIKTCTVSFWIEFVRKLKKKTGKNTKQVDEYIPLKELGPSLHESDVPLIDTTMLK